MPEESKESKAQKLAAARKKLKEYQKRGTDTQVIVGEAISSAAESVSSNVSEKSNSELNLNGQDTILGGDVSIMLPEQIPVEPVKEVATAEVADTPTVTTPTIESYFNDPASVPTVAHLQIHDMPEYIPEAQKSLSAIQVLISEKAQLTSELNKYYSLCREKDLELEELRTQYDNSLQHVAELQDRVLTQQTTTEQVRKSNAELHHKMAMANANCEDQATHLEELRKQLRTVQTHAADLERQFKEKCNEYDMSQIRIRQLSDETVVTSDNRVETLTQTQFMHEQQIRDLQAMVQQLTQDKEQANTQYQNYAQHLNAEVLKLNEKNSELFDENTKQQERERQLIDHISNLERDIQRNISRQDQIKLEKKEENLPNESNFAKEIERQNEKISDFEFERHEFQLKIKSQEDHIEKLTAQLQENHSAVEMMKERLNNVNAEQPDKVRLLATMESDKVAASRALTQNAELKKQLDELELRFVQLTNDKADLINELDAVAYANRELRSSHTTIEERLRLTDERLQYKDEEMIRLSHENMELTRKNLILETNAKYSEDEYDEASYDKEAEEHYNKYYGNNDQHEHNNSLQEDNDNNNQGEQHAGSNACQEVKENGEVPHTAPSCAHEHDHDHDHEHGFAQKQHRHNHQQAVRSASAVPTPQLPSSEAVVKLQERFTKLMQQVADLTDEKQRLEHLVLQLQSETETIGEYIALYQTQRRILNQREYEKAAQMQLLQTEREQMREKITMLNNLVSSLGAEFPHNMRLKEHLNSALVESVSIEPRPGEEPQPNSDQSQQQNNDELALNDKLNYAESQEILTKIQNIITEIKENTKEVPTVPQTVDHLNCCMGKFEVV